MYSVGEKQNLLISITSNDIKRTKNKFKFKIFSCYRVIYFGCIREVAQLKMIL